MGRKKIIKEVIEPQLLPEPEPQPEEQIEPVNEPIELKPIEEESDTDSLIVANKKKDIK
jgi:hypothetical protein